MNIPEKPMTREEMYLNRLAAGTGEIPEYPMTRYEAYLDMLCKNGGGYTKAQIDSMLAGKGDKTDVEANTEAIAAKADKTTATYENDGLLSATDKQIYDEAVSMINAAYNHNSLYRGKDITAAFNSGAFSSAVSNGTFDDIYIGDYITKAITVDGVAKTCKATIAHIDPFFGDHNSNAIINKHHVAVILDWGESNKMNNTNTTEGGYRASKLHRHLVTDIVPVLEANNAFGNHLVAHKKLLTKDMDPNRVNRFGEISLVKNGDTITGIKGTGASSDGEWTDPNHATYPDTGKISLLTECQVYGHTVWSSSGHDTGEGHQQFAIFTHINPQKLMGTAWWWLRDIASATQFANVGGWGNADCYGAAGSGGVRPFILLS